MVILISQFYCFHLSCGHGRGCPMTPTECTPVIILLCLRPRIGLWGKYYYAPFDFSSDVRFTNTVCLQDKLMSMEDDATWWETMGGCLKQFYCTVSILHMQHKTICCCQIIFHVQNSVGRKVQRSVYHSPWWEGTTYLGLHIIFMDNIAAGDNCLLCCQLLMFVSQYMYTLCALWQSYTVRFCTL